MLTKTLLPLLGQIGMNKIKKMIAMLHTCGLSMDEQVRIILDVLFKEIRKNAQAKRLTYTPDIVNLDESTSSIEEIIGDLDESTSSIEEVISLNDSTSSSDSIVSVVSAIEID